MKTEADDDILDQVEAEVREDYVGLWKISRLLLERGVHESAIRARTVHLVRRMVYERGLVLGSFDGERFVEWPGTPEQQFLRLHNDLAALGRVPTIGDVCWLSLQAGASE